MRISQLCTAGVIIIASACNSQTSFKNDSVDHVKKAPQQIVVEERPTLKEDHSESPLPVMKSWQEQALELKERYGVKSPALVHPSISLDQLPLRTIVAEGENVCQITKVDISELPKIELERDPNIDSLSNSIFNFGTATTLLLAPYSSLYCDYIDQFTSCEVKSDSPIFYHGKTKTVKIVMNDIQTDPEIHFSDHDIICRQRYWE